MEKLKLITQPSEPLALHDDILDILFKHKQEIYRQFIDIRGILLIDHIAIHITDPNNKIVVMSISPSVEYNLIIQELWQYDKCFLPNDNNNGKLQYWDDAYSQQHYLTLKKLKEHKHGFTLGFYLVRQCNLFQLTYSFATRSNNQDLKNYYESQSNELLAIGDYGYRLVSHLYQQYCPADHAPPSLTSNDTYKAKPRLTLITS